MSRSSRSRSCCSILIFVGKNHIFPWTHETLHVPEKITYLNPAFLIPRSLIAFGLIAGLSLWYIYTTVRLDVGHSPEAGASWARGLRERMRRGFRDERREIHSTHSRQGYMAVVLGFSWAFGWIVLSWDLSMSLDLHFQSTMYGWWVFMGGWVTALASFTIIVMSWRRYLDRYDLITEKHFHDLGKLCFAFTAFWGYLTFGQYLVIWYGNLGEETHWARLTADSAVASAYARDSGPDVRSVLRTHVTRGESVSPDACVVCFVHRVRALVPPVSRSVSVALLQVDEHSARTVGDRCRAWISRHLGFLLSVVHGRIPQNASDSHDVAAP